MYNKRAHYKVCRPVVGVGYVCVLLLFCVRRPFLTNLQVLTVQAYVTRSAGKAIDHATGEALPAEPFSLKTRGVSVRSNQWAMLLQTVFSQSLTPGCPFLSRSSILSSRASSLSPL